jgi:hypothetical protein
MPPQQPATRTFANIPGLTLHLGVASPKQQARLIADTLALRRRVGDAVNGFVARGGRAITVEVPQPIRSERHNLAEEKSFFRVKVCDSAPNDGRVLNCEHFADYGSSGHTLSYFQRKPAIPSYIQHDLIDRFVAGLPEVAALAQQAGTAAESLAYKLSLNSYIKNRSADREADETLFAYHVDLPGNGEFTAILTLASAGCIQFAASLALLAERPGEGLPSEAQPETIVLPVGSLLVAVGDARWRFVHRVIPTPAEVAPRAPVDVGDGISRFSLVLGCQDTKWKSDEMLAAEGRLKSARAQSATPA